MAYLTIDGKLLLYNGKPIVAPNGGEITLQEKTATPTKSVQSITPDSGYDGLSVVTVEAIPDDYIQPSGNKTITTNGTHDVKAYENAVVSVPSTVPNLQEKTITPTTSAQNVQADSGYDGLSKVTVGAVTSTIDGDITAGNIKKGVEILGVTGTLEEGAPIEFSTTAEAESIIASATDADLNKVYKYTGATDGTYENGCLYALKSTGWNGTDLTGTTWVLNDTLIDSLPIGVYYITGHTNSNENFTSVERASLRNECFCFKYNNVRTAAYNYDTSSWVYPEYKNITITGGTDATNETLISWLEANGTLISW